MFKRILLWVSALLLLSNYASAQNFFISGGNKFSAVLCDNGNVFTWGDNAAGQLGRTAPSQTSIPGLVDIFDEYGNVLKISAVDAGSGAHVVAMACDSTVWTWGEGLVGQLGHGSFLSSSTPVQVLAGETKKSTPLEPLEDVIYVTSGTSQSYAITKDKRLVSWGSNMRNPMDNNGIGGQLGSDGKGWDISGPVPTLVDLIEDSPLPVYVRDENGDILENVVAVDAGDYHCYAIVDDDGDGDPKTGHVYAWGVAWGGTNPVVSSAFDPAQSTVARMVVDKDGTPLEKIYMITAGDAAGYFIQKGTGYVYSVGSNNEGQRGDGETYVNDNNRYAILVQSGDLMDSTGYESLSNVSVISAGQTHGMAVVNYNDVGYLMTWGGNVGYVAGATLSETGVLGHDPAGSADKAPLPKFVKHCDGSILKNVVSVSDGDFTSYAITMDPKTKEREVWIWGHNGQGQVGMGGPLEDNTMLYSCPQKFVEPQCAMADPCPVAELGSDTMFVCSARPKDTLYAGKDSEGQFRKYIWKYVYKGVEIDISKDTVRSGAYLRINRLGRYILEIQDIRPTETCNGCPIASDTIDIVMLESPFDTVMPSFCGVDGTFKVNLKAGVDSFAFYSRESEDVAGDMLLAVKGDAKITQSGSAVTFTVEDLKSNAVDRLYTDSLATPTDFTDNVKYQDSIYSIWIEDRTISKGSVLSNPTLESDQKGVSDATASAVRFMVYQDAYVESATVTALVDNLSLPGQMNITPVVYGGKKTSEGAPLPDDLTVLWEGLEQTFDFTGAGNHELVVKFEDGAAGVPLFLKGDANRGNTYFISFKVTQTNAQNMKYYIAPAGYSEESTYGANVLIADVFADTRNNSNAAGYTQSKDINSFMHDFVILKPTDYTCGRKEIQIIKKCPPCSGVSTLTASITKDTICASEDVIVSFEATANSTAVPAEIAYEWYKIAGGIESALTTETGTLTSTTNSFSTSDTGYYYVKLYDTKDPLNGKCIFTDTVHLAQMDAPTYEFTEGQTVCEGVTPDTLHLLTTGYGPWTVDLGGAAPETFGSAGDETGALTLTPSSTLDTEYALISIEDKYCTGTTSGGDTALVKINPNPEIEFDIIKGVCTDGAAVELATYASVTGESTLPATVEYVAETAGLTITGSKATPAEVTTDTDYDIYAKYEDANGCRDSALSTLSVYAKPVVDFTIDDKYCSEASIDLGSAVDQTGGTFTSSPSASIPATNILAAADLAQAGEAVTEYTFTYVYEDTHGCDTTVTAKTNIVTVPDVGSTVDFTVSGVKEDQFPITGDLAAYLNTTYTIPATSTLEMNWEDSLFQPTTIHDEEIAMSFENAGTFKFPVYQTLDGCVGKTDTVRAFISSCSAETPVAKEDWFCATAPGKTIDISNGDPSSTAQYGWAAVGTSFKDLATYTDSDVQGPEYTITETTKGDYDVLVAAWDDIEQCWSEPATITFHVVDEPVVSIQIPTDEDVVCYNDNVAKEITLTPSMTGDGITATFKINGDETLVNTYVPKDYANTADVVVPLEYTVIKRISPSSVPDERFCEALTPATASVTVQYIGAPTITDETWPLEDAATAPSIVATGATGNSFIWYDENDDVISGQTSDEYDIIATIATPAEQKYTASAAQVSPEGCVSEKAEGSVELVECPFGEPAVKDGFAVCYDDAVATTPALELDKLSNDATYGAQTTDYRYVWLDENNDSIGAGNSFVPAELGDGTETYTGTVSVKVVALVTSTGKYCASLPTDIGYTVYRMPKPTVEIPETELCVYSDPITIKGFDDGKTVSSGTFNISPGTPVTGGSFSFVSSDHSAQEYSIEFEYTTPSTEGGCTVTSAAKTLEVFEVQPPVLTDYDGSIDDVNAAGDVFDFSATPAAGTSIEWYVVKPIEPYNVPSEASGSPFTLNLATTATGVPVDFADQSDEYTYTVWATQKMTAGPGCQSTPEKSILTVTDCPVPKPFVDDEIACDYWSDNEMPQIIAVRGTDWNGYTPDLSTSIERRVGSTVELAPAGTYRFPGNLDPDQIYEVEFRVTSPTMYSCSSPWVSAKLEVLARPEISQKKPVQAWCFNDDSEQTLEITASADGGSTTGINWYWDSEETDPTGNIGTGHPFNGLDLQTNQLGGEGGTVNVYAVAKMTASPECKSLPWSATLEVYDEIPAPTISDEQYCANPYYSYSESGVEKPEFPKENTNYLLFNSLNNTEWVDSLDRVLEDGSLLVMSESDLFFDYGVIPGGYATFYGRSYVVTNNKRCYSDYDDAKLYLQWKPMQPTFLQPEGSGKEGTYCQGDEDTDVPPYQVETKLHLDGPFVTDPVFHWFTTEWYDNAISVDTLNFIDTILYTGDTLSLLEYVRAAEAQDLGFTVLEEYTMTYPEGDLTCYSQPKQLSFTIAEKPFAQADTPAVRVCSDPEGEIVISAVNVDESANLYTWECSAEDEYFGQPDGKSYKFTWWHKYAGTDIAVLKVVDKETECFSFDSVYLYSAEHIEPEFDFSYYNGPQEIVFSNVETVDTVGKLFPAGYDTSRVEFKDGSYSTETIIYEPYMTEYEWSFVYNKTQEERVYAQYPATTLDSLNSKYYVGYGPTDYYYSVIPSDSVNSFTEDTVTWFIRGSKLTEVNEKIVEVLGGVPFEYGASTVTLTRSIQGYDNASCKVSSEPVEVFMEITTGLYIPTSLVPGHPSPLVSVFKPFGHNLQEYKIWIYDNWGNTVFYSDKLDEKGQPVDSWTGRDKDGNIMPADCYIWKIDATFDDGSKWEGIELESGKKRTTGSVCVLR